MKRVVIAAVVLAAGAGLAFAQQTAKAELKDAQGQSVGTVTLTDTPNGVLIHAALTNVPPGVHAFHIHQTGACEAPFTTAGAHFNPGMKQHGMTNPMGMHAGDMPNIEVPRFQMWSQNPMLGIEGESLGQQEQLAEFFGVQAGVLGRNVKKGSAAEKAGLRAGDVITKVDDSKVTSTAEITRVLRGAKSKKSVNITVVRNKKEMPLTVTVETAGNSVRASLSVVDC